MKTWANKALVMALLAFVPGRVGASIYYLSPSGSDAANGLSEGAAWQSFAYAFSRMTGGDELILLDGIYSDGTGTGYINWNDGSTPKSGQPPSGTSLANMTVVRAKNSGQVTVIGASGAERQGLFIGRSVRKDSYIRIQGIKFEYGGYLWNTSFITIKDCAFHSERLSAGAVFTIGVNPATHTQGNFYNLIEDCWIWGKERIIASNYNANCNTWRRVVIRGDGCSTMSSSGNPNVGFTIYDSTGVSAQNMIVVDRILDGGYPYGAFATAINNQSLGPNEWFGCIVLKNEDGGFVFGDDAPANPNSHTLINCVAWDCGLQNINMPPPANNPRFENLTLGLPGVGYDSFRIDPAIGAVGTITNIICYKPGRYGINSPIVPTYVDVYDAATASYNQTTCVVGPRSSDPLNDGNPASLKFLVRIEEGSVLKGTGSGGADYGATVLKRYGTEGSRYQETNYNSLTTTDLWPWPNESRIRSDMSVSSTRGFCAPGMTLTKYIWEYLGNPMPSNFYTMNAPSGLSAAAVSATSIVLSWSDNSYNETGFKIERKTGASGTYAQIATVGADVTTFTDTGLIAATQYYYRVRTYNATDETSYSNESSATTLLSNTGNNEPGTGDTGSIIGNMPSGEVKVLGSTERRGTINPDAGDTVKIYFKGTETGRFECRVFTLTGELVWQDAIQNVSEGMFEWIPQNIASGGYVVYVKGPGVNVKKKIAVVR